MESVALSRQIQLDNQLENTNQAEKARLQKALSQMQMAYINKELLLARLLDAPIPGLGPKLKDRIRDSGISSAADVNQFNVRNITGLGEAKIQELLEWRRYIENQAQRLMPKRLDPETEDNIINEFGQAKANIRLEKVKEANKLAEAIEYSKAASATLIAENIDDTERQQDDLF